MNVRDGNSAVYSFCTEFHLCTHPNCENPRVRRNGEDLQFCHDHRCDHDSCRNLKEFDPFCRRHTCNDAHCTSFVSSGDIGDVGNPERFCERHRRCLKPYCGRFCHVRENGFPSPFCGAHYCEFSDCSNEREAAAHCPEHTCGEPGCLKGRESVRGQYCKEHGYVGRADFSSVRGCFAKVSTTGWDAAGLSSEVPDTANITSAKSGNAEIPGHLRLSTAAATGASSQDATGQEDWQTLAVDGAWATTSKGCSATAMRVARLDAATRSTRIRNGVLSMGDAGRTDIGSGWMLARTTQGIEDVGGGRDGEYIRGGGRTTARDVLVGATTETVGIRGKRGELPCTRLLELPPTDLAKVLPAVLLVDAEDEARPKTAARGLP
ncbi:hypothetical protein G7Z17_g11988 [Cylindrodendrum hubeiense]|uniref:Uncharacterized protein n=1 Tax=Cylindrodendrum hubeiense TaxID=595255 RepID=A0A9P5LAS0_9HYPO|nr:hypothetical protein G7Z17_g11988 [Cylindrodendrum hubeiense]